MKKLFAVALLVSGAAFAADHKDHKDHKAPKADWKALDKDGNGTLSAEEAAADKDITAHFAAADKDGNGQLTSDEWKAFAATQKAHK